jgi:endonuclease YncB( thermonuclease family)
MGNIRAGLRRLRLRLRLRPNNDDPRHVGALRYLTQGTITPADTGNSITMSKMKLATIAVGSAAGAFLLLGSCGALASGSDMATAGSAITSSPAATASPANPPSPSARTIRPETQSPTTKPSAATSPASESVSPEAPTSDSLARTAVPVLDVVDGDTIKTSVGTVRLIGIDTPERGECNYQAATLELGYALAAHGNTVVLASKSGEDTDKYGRLLRYFESAKDGTDFNLHMVSTGLAIARYDSRDGYGAHPRESSYISTDAANGAPACAATQAPTPPPTAAPAPFAQAAPAPAAGAAGGAEPWNQPGPDLDCADIGHVVYITGPDYHNLDRDRDGIGCESYN